MNAGDGASENRIQCEHLCESHCKGTASFCTLQLLGVQYSTVVIHTYNF
jgi:hypothetical protein